jgi:hypothetical protein
MDGSEMGGVKFDAPVNESLADIAKRTAAIGAKFVEENGGKRERDTLAIRFQQPATMPAELFPLSRLTEFWNPDWKLTRAGFGGAGGGMSGIRGLTYVDGDVLATYPRDEVRGTRLERSVKLGPSPRLQLDAGADAGRAWRLDMHVDNTLVHTGVIQGKAERTWERIDIDLAQWAGKQVTIRLIQRVLLGPDKAPGNAYWRNVQIR